MSTVQAVVGAVLIVLGLVFVVGPWFVGPPGSRGHSLWIVAGVLLLTGAVD